MSQFQVGSSAEFNDAWKAAVKDARIELAELQKLAGIADQSPDKADDELIQRLIDDYKGRTRGDFTVQMGKSKQAVVFVDGHHSIHVSPSEVNNHNVFEFIDQRLVAAENALKQLDSKDPGYAAKEAGVIKELVEKDLTQALDLAMGPKGGEIPKDKANAVLMIMETLQQLRN